MNFVEIMGWPFFIGMVVFFVIGLGASLWLARRA